MQNGKGRTLDRKDSSYRLLSEISRKVRLPF